jgi:Ferritin-like domain
MRNILPSCVALLAGLTAAIPLPLSRRADNIDIVILQFALTVSSIFSPARWGLTSSQLEHLENVFYKEALLRFSEDDFQKAGFDKKFFEKLLFVVEDEQSHVQLLGKAIAATGTTPVAACNYNFPYTDVYVSYSITEKSC